MMENPRISRPGIRKHVDSYCVNWPYAQFPSQEWQIWMQTLEVKIGTVNVNRIY